MNITYIVYGVADRDANEPVCQVFETLADAHSFAYYLPGKYQVMTVTGVDYEAFDVLSNEALIDNENIKADGLCIEVGCTDAADEGEHCFIHAPITCHCEDCYAQDAEADGVSPEQYEAERAARDEARES